MTFKLPGFDNPRDEYPAPVIPIGRLDGKLIAVYPGGRQRFDPIPEGCLYNHLTREQLESFRDFDPLRHFMFADDETHVFIYLPNEEKQFLRDRLSNPEFCKNSPEMRKILEEAAR